MLEVLRVFEAGASPRVRPSAFGGIGSDRAPAGGRDEVDCDAVSDEAGRDHCCFASLQS